MNQTNKRRRSISIQSVRLVKARSRVRAYLAVVVLVDVPVQAPVVERPVEERVEQVVHHVQQGQCRRRVDPRQLREPPYHLWSHVTDGLF